MSSPHGAHDANDAGLGALTNEERAALAAWADEDDPPDGFADRVVVSLLAERLRHADEGDDADAGGAEAAAVRSRATIGEGRVVRLVGFVAAIAAAAAVMLMVRVLPGASAVEVGRERESARVAEAAPALSPLPPEPQAVVPEVGSAREEVVLGADAGHVLAQHCSPCHDADDPEANPAALQVFDLTQPQWWITMSDAQLEEARMRVQELGAASDDERRRVNAFVEARQRSASHAG